MFVHSGRNQLLTFAYTIAYHSCTLRYEGDELLIRPISARYMHKKEMEAYEKENPDL